MHEGLLYHRVQFNSQITKDKVKKCIGITKVNRLRSIVGMCKNMKIPRV